MKQYFYIDSNNQQIGPISEEAVIALLKCGAISRQTLIWAEGMPGWQPVCAVFPESAKETCIPTLGVEPSTTVPEAPAASLPQDLPKLWSKYRKLFIIGGAVALIAAFSFTAYFVSDSGDSSSPVSATAKKKRFKPRKISKEKAVKELRELGVISSELDIQNSVGSGAMENACAQGNINITELLLTGGTNVKQINKNYCLARAAENGHAEIVKLLLAMSGIDVNRSDKWTPLVLAAINGHAEVVKLLLAAPGIDVNEWKPLLRASEEGHAEVVKLLLAAPEIDVNTEVEVFGSGRGRIHTPLKYATINGHAEIVKLLVEAPGIDVNAEVPLALAAEDGHTEIVKLLLAAPGIDVNKGEPLAQAAENGHAEVVKLLLAAPGIKLHDNAALCYAAEHGHVEIVKLLLAAPGIEVTRGVLEVATENGHTEIVKLLRAAGARE